MQRVKLNEYFYIDEYISPEMYQKWGSTSIWWIRPELIAVDLFIRKRHGVPMIMNNWAIGGANKSSGFRYPVALIGAGDSFHKFGVASDNTWWLGDPLPQKEEYKRQYAMSEKVRNDIKENWKELYKPLGLTTIEANTPHLHKDCRHILNQTQLFIVYPK